MGMGGENQVDVGVDCRSRAFVGMTCVAPVGMTRRDCAQGTDETGDPGRIRTSDLQLRRLGGSSRKSKQVDTYLVSRMSFFAPVVDTGCRDEACLFEIGCPQPSR